MASITVFANGSTGVNDATVGTISWFNATNVGADDGVRSTADFSGTATSKYLRAAPQSLAAIPAGAVINGIKVEVDEDTNGGTCTTAYARLYKSGTGWVGDNRASDDTADWDNRGVATYGGAAILWGTTWTRDEVVNNLQFGISCTKPDANSAYVDFYRFTIYYTLPLDQFAGSGALTFGGSASIGGSLQQFIASGALTFGGSVKMPGQFAGEGVLTFDGEAEFDITFFVKWSLDHLEARLDYGFPTVWLEMDSSSAISGAFPTGDVFERRLLEIPRLEEIELDSRYGIAGFQRASLVLDNSDGFFNSVNMQGAFARMFFVNESGTAYKEFKGRAVDWTLSHRAVVNVEDIDALAITKDFPIRTLNMLVEAEKIADPTFSTYVIANDLGKPIPVIFGRAIKVPLLYVKADDTNREYDYIIGEGVGYSGNFQYAYTVYRQDQALDSIDGTVSSATSTTLTLESADQRPTSWYKYWFVEILTGPGSYEVRNITAYDGTLNRITVNSAWDVNPTSSSTYRLREWYVYDGSQASPYAGYAFLRFKKRMGSTGQTDPIYADVNGLQGEINVVRAIQSLLTNEDWGLGLEADTSSFNTAAALSSITAMSCEGVIADSVAAIDVFRELLGFRDMVLSKDDAIRITVDSTKTSTHSFGLGDATGWNNILNPSPEVSYLHPNDKVKNLKVRYRKNNKESDIYLHELERVSSTNGVDTVVNLPFVYSHDTADRWLDYKRKRFAAAVKRLVLDVGQEGANTTRGSLATVTIPSIGVGGSWEVAGTNVTPAGGNSLSLVPYSASPYTYEAGTLPSDASFDIAADFSKTAPDPVSGVSVTMSMNTLAVSQFPFTKITWTPPEDNYGGAIVYVKLHSETDSLFRGKGKFTDSARIDGLTPGQRYDFSIVSLNVTGEIEGLGVLADNGGVGYLAGGDSSAPSTPTGLTGVSKFGILQWTFTRSASTDVWYHEYEIYTASSGGTRNKRGKIFADDDPEFSFQGTTGSLTTTVTKYAQVRAVDYSGNASAFTSRVSASSDSILQLDVGSGQITNKQSQSNAANTAAEGIINSVSITLAGNDVTVDVDMSWRLTVQCGLIISIRRSGTYIYGATDSGLIQPGHYHIKVTDNPGAGTFTYEFQVGNNSGIADRVLTVEERKR